VTVKVALTVTMTATVAQVTNCALDMMCTYTLVEERVHKKL
jgi:hypothetical protein